MKTFQVIQLSDGDYAVQVGKARRQGGDVYRKYIEGTESPDRAAVKAKVAYYRAGAYLGEALKLVEKTSLDDAKSLARDAEELVRRVVDRCEAEDPDFDQFDARGFLA